MRRVLSISMVLSLNLGGLITAGVAPNGPEFQVNTYTPDDQRYPAIATGATGDYVVAWRSTQLFGLGVDIFAQRFDSGGNPQGGEFQVNTNTLAELNNYIFGISKSPAVGMDGSGNFVVTWQSRGQGTSYNVFGQRFDSMSNPQGGEYQVNSYTGTASFPDVGMSEAGGFVVVWEDSSRDTSLQGILGRRFDSLGSPQGAEFQVNTYTTGSQASPAISMADSGSFTVVWQSYDQDGSSYGVFGQRFDSLASPQGGEFQINTHTSGDVPSSVERRQRSRLRSYATCFFEFSARRAGTLASRAAMS